MNSLAYGVPYASSRQRQLLRRFVAGKTDTETARELNDRESRIAAQRQRLAEKFQIYTHEQLVEFANKLDRYPTPTNRDL